MIEEEQIKNDVLGRAREWAEVNGPLKCHNRCCGAVDMWQLGKVGRVNSYLVGVGKDPDPPTSFAVPVVCSHCGCDIKHYEE